MSNFFEEALTAPKELEEKLLGPSYNYYEFIKNPSQMGMKAKGSVGAITNNISGLIGLSLIHI